MFHSFASSPNNEIEDGEQVVTFFVRNCFLLSHTLLKIAPQDSRKELILKLLFIYLFDINRYKYLQTIKTLIGMRFAW